MGYFACIKIRVLCVIGSLGYYKSNFQGVHFFVDISETRISRKYVLRENIYVQSNSFRSCVITLFSETPHFKIFQHKKGKIITIAFLMKRVFFAMG